jgi:putative SOS response-associated peptidase YedK
VIYRRSNGPVPLGQELSKTIGADNLCLQLSAISAGIWDHWKNPEGETLETCSILTTASNSLIQAIHDRMPVILHPEEFDLWLDREVTEPEKLLSLYQPYPPDLMEMHRVTPLVNNVRNDSPDCIEPISEM